MFPCSDFDESLEVDLHNSKAILSVKKSITKTAQSKVPCLTNGVLNDTALILSQTVAKRSCDQKINTKNG